MNCFTSHPFDTCHEDYTKPQPHDTRTRAHTRRRDDGESSVSRALDAGGRRLHPPCVRLRRAVDADRDRILSQAFGRRDTQSRRATAGARRQAEEDVDRRSARGRGRFRGANATTVVDVQGRCESDRARCHARFQVARIRGERVPAS